MKVYLTTAIVVIAIATAAFYVSKTRSQPREVETLTPQKSFTPIRIGHSIWPGYYSLFVAHAKGFDKEEGISLELIPYPDFDAMQEDLKKGEIDLMGDTIDGLAYHTFQGDIKRKAVLIFDYSNGGDGILASPKAPSLSGAKGRTIAVASMPTYTIGRALELAKLPVSDVIIATTTTDDELLSLLAAEKVDYIQTYEPYLSQGIARGGKLVYSTRGDPGIVTDVLSASDKLIKTNPEAIRALLRAYGKAIDYTITHKDESDTIVAKALSINREDLHSQLDRIDILDENTNVTGMRTFAGQRSLMFAAGLATQFYEKLLNRKSTLTIGDIIDTSFVNAVWKKERRN